MSICRICGQPLDGQYCYGCESDTGNWDEDSLPSWCNYKPKKIREYRQPAFGSGLASETLTKIVMQNPKKYRRVSRLWSIMKNRFSIIEKCDKQIPRSEKIALGTLVRKDTEAKIKEYLTDDEARTFYLNVIHQAWCKFLGNIRS